MMTERSKREKKNIYEIAGKVGKGVKKSGSVLVGVALTVLVTKVPDLIKKIKK